jgi:hypothetical protein
VTFSLRSDGQPRACSERSRRVDCLPDSVKGVTGEGARATNLPPTRSLRDEWSTRTSVNAQSAAVRRRLTASVK